MCFDGESPEFYNEKIVRANKAHTCYECNSAIIKGDRYQRCSGKWNSEFSEFKLCLDCMTMREKIQRIEISHGCSHSESSPPFGELRYVRKEYLEIEETK